MKINKYLAKHPAILHASDLEEICSPLKLLDITYFSHVNINEKNEFAGLGLIPEFVKLYFSKGYYHHDSHMVSYGKGESYEIVDSVSLLKESRSIVEDLSSFNHGHTFSIIVENEAGKDCYHFATKNGNDTMNGKYLQMIGSLKQFIRYFKDCIANHKELVKTYDLRLQLDNDIGGYHTDNQTLKLDEFCKTIQTNRLYSLTGNQYLTKREIECLHCLAQGKTFEEVSVILGISARTVKAHITAIKEKIGCDNQFQLGMNFAKFDLS